MILAVPDPLLIVEPASEPNGHVEGVLPYHPIQPTPVMRSGGLTGAALRLLALAPSQACLPVSEPTIPPVHHLPNSVWSVGRGLLISIDPVILRLAPWMWTRMLSDMPDQSLESSML